MNTAPFAPDWLRSQMAKQEGSTNPVVNNTISKGLTIHKNTQQTQPEQTARTHRSATQHKVYLLNDVVGESREHSLRDASVLQRDLCRAEHEEAH